MFGKTALKLSATIFSTLLLTGTTLSKNRQPSDDSPLVFATFNIHEVGLERLESIKDKVAHSLSIEADSELILLTTSDALKNAPLHTVSRVIPKPDQLFVVRKAHDDLLGVLEGDVIAKAGRSAVVQANSQYLPQLVWHPAIEKLSGSVVLAKQAANDNLNTGIRFSSETNLIVDAVNSQRWFEELRFLSTLNRYSRGSQIQQAQKYLEDTLANLPGFEVSTQEFSVSGTKAYNVIGKLTGTTRPDDWIIVSAHYDSISQSTDTAAPGAEDNGSGTAGMLELARVFSQTRPEATILFIGFSGEEQGLKGSYAHVAKVVADGDKDMIRAVLNMDMIGFTRDADLDCLLESDQRGSALFPLLTAAAQQYTSLRIVTSLNPFGSDHVPYIERGITSLLVIENDWSEYSSYHKTTDKIENITIAMGEQTLRMEAAVVAQLSGATSKR